MPLFISSMSAKKHDAILNHPPKTPTYLCDTTKRHLDAPLVFFPLPYCCFTFLLLFSTLQCISCHTRLKFSSSL